MTQFGRHTATYDGATTRCAAACTCAGRRRFSPCNGWTAGCSNSTCRRRSSSRRDPGGQTIDRTLTVEGFVCWRIADADGVDRFIRTVGTPDRARSLLSQQISSQLSAEIGKMEHGRFRQRAAGPGR